jgi:membrane peptidoglycan carboxypeptidase
VSSKADDFDVRYRDDRDDRTWGSGADGDYPDGDHADGGHAGTLGGTVDYDLGYDANGWDTQGFRSPTAGYLDNHETAQLGAGTDARPQEGLGHDAAPGYSPASGYGAHGSGAHESGPANGHGNGRGGSHARTSGTQQPVAPASTGSWPPEETGQTVQLNQPGRRGRRARTGARQSTQSTQAQQGMPGPYGLQGSPPSGPRGPRRGPRVKVKGSWWRHWTWRKALGVVLSITGAFIILGAIVIAMAYEETPVPSAAMAATGYAQSVVYSSDGTVIGRFGTTNRVNLTYNQIPTSLIWAVLAIEDRNFFNEGGVSPTGIIRAAYDDLTGSDGSLQGGSTITQEFVRQYYAGIGTQQTMSRKIKEIFVAMKVAKQKSKPWILTNFLNTIYFGEGAYGVQAAAETFFNKPVSELTVAQDAVIAAVIQQPSTYPLPQYRPELIARWHSVITGMVATGHLSAQQAATMKFPGIGDHVAQSTGKQVWDPYVLSMVRTELKNVYGLNDAQIDDGGYVITTSIDDAKMTALYAAINQNEEQIDQSTAYPFKSYMRAGAVLEDPASGAIQAVYAGPGYPGYRYNGTGKIITETQCHPLQCQYDMATENREQVGSSFKPYILATAVKAGMNVQTSTLDGFTPLSIPPDSQPGTYPQTSAPAGASGWSLQVNNDSPGENGPYTPQVAMAASINTAYANLWHVVAGPDGMNVLDMAQSLGVDISDPDSGMYASRDEATLALGQASLTVAEQASMLATLDDNGVYHQQHLITKLTDNGVPTPIKVTSGLVFNSNPVLNAELDSQVQYAMSEDTASYGTAPVAAMSNGQEIIAKTGTTETAQTAFFIGAIPSQALAVALFTHDQNGSKTDPQSLNSLGGQAQGGFGGTWPATIWHTYAENMFVKLGLEKFQPVVFTGFKWNEVPPNLRKTAKKHPKKNTNNNQNPSQGTGPGSGNGNGNGGNGGNGNPNPYPTYSCDPTVVTCNPNQGGTAQSGAPAAGAALGGIFAGLPAVGLWVRRRGRRRVAKRG